MTSGRRSRALRRTSPGPVATPPTLSVARPSHSGPCWRCGGGCRKHKHKHPYGWVCGVCADELDRYYILLLGLRGGTVAERFGEDLAAGRVPKTTRSGSPRESRSATV
jgi:hypothetical protein